MRIAYLILAHTLPGQLARLVRRLAADGDGPIVVHVDERRRAAFAAVTAELRGVDRVAVISGHRVTWGHISMVDALLDGIDVILRRDPAVTHIKHLSGQDYPCQPLAAFRAFLAAHPNRSCMEFRALPTPVWVAGGERDGGLGRVTRPRLRVGQGMLALPFLRIRVPADVRLHGGSALWCLTRAHAEHVLGSADRLRRVFRLAANPDEMFFQTALASAAHRGEVLDNGMTYVAWEHGAPSPKILSLADLPALLESGCWFARKFDVERHPEPLDELDRLQS